MLINEAHLQTLHGGNKLTMAVVRQKYWILGLKRMTKSSIRNCVKCIRYKAATASQKMGQLPEPRVTPSQTFSHTGVDMAGPIQVRTTKGRGNKATKGYIAVFVCLATKAIHLELVGDLSTESFIAALIRFKARRGHISHIYSDNGRNFVGAARMLHTQLLEIMQSPHVQNAVTTMGTQWHFNPPLAPHFGGIWEAGVKAMKYHLKRVIGESTLTYEELSTLLSQVESCLNSRPLCAQSDNINDNTVLTPSHFLIGREAVGIPDPINDVSTNLQQRWKLIQKMKKDFWKTWSRDYLHQLQQRYKWQLDQGNINKGTVVLIKDENVTPSQWPLAKVIETHPGADGKTRVLTLQKAPGNCLKRAIHKVIPLPNNKEDITETQQVVVNSNVAQLTPVNATSDQSNRTVTKESRRQSNKRTGRKYPWTLFITLFTCFINMTTATYTIKNINEGIYVEHVGSATIDRGIFRIQTNYEKSKIGRDVEDIRGITAQFKHYCDAVTKTNTEIHCAQLYHQLYEGQERLEEITNLILNIGQIRKKRGLFGQMLTSIFGVNDEVYKDIDTLQGNQNKLIEAANHQTKFMISTIATVNQTEERIVKKLETFQTKLNQAIQYMNNVNKWYKRIDINRVNINILHMYQLAAHYIDEVIEHYARLQEAYLHQGTIYDVLQLKEVNQILTNANSKLPTKLRIVQNQLIDTKVTENSTYIKVYGYFALQDITKYTLIHVTPVPKQDKKGKVYSLEVYHNIIAIDYNNENYFELETEEFKACLRKNTEYICYPTSVKNMQENKNCIIDLLFKGTEMVNCNTRELNLTTTVWKQLYMPNTWLIMTAESVKASIICDGEREEIMIQNTTVIHIAENCIIKTRRNILAARRANSISVLATFSRQANFSLNTNETTNQIEDLTRDEEVLDSSRDIFKHLTSNENLLQKQLDNTIWKQIQNNSVAISLGSSLAVFSLMILTVCYGPQVLVQIRSCTTSPQSAPLPAAPARSAPPKPKRHKTNPTNNSSQFEEIELRPIQPL
ncbi:uncharacterized protein LOC125234071 [Leguminivora glycinivorella]|uniref:uncharacterized protein LOC125234071 n=1 Tax=Leguminivora glycinivorella TaxID=1035111 RepID=UPI00200EF7EE|nr:uncharacterized protein LOC125234071 [Leguminivora glycinivorella]